MTVDKAGHLTWRGAFHVGVGNCPRETIDPC